MSTGIRSMADELREQLRQEESGQPADQAPAGSTVTAKTKKVPDKDSSAVKKLPASKVPEPLAALFDQLAAYELTGTEKLLIRLDGKTVFLLKQLKIVKGVDMNKLIAYSVQYFLETNPELIPFIKRSLNHLEL